MKNTFLVAFIVLLATGEFSMAWDAKKFIKPTDRELKNKLTPKQYEVTQHEGTEPSFKNEYHNNKEPGLYVDIISGEPLFSSTDKYDSGTGWPSFTRPIRDDVVITREDNKLFSKRTEVRSRYADSHLGHVFSDGPAPTYKRYCMNSAALRFILASKLKSEGYDEEFKQLFGQNNPSTPSIEKAIFAGGCFWCLQPPYDKLKGAGVIEVLVGYSGGDSVNPNYEKVSAGGSGHKEVIEVSYDPTKISYEKLLEVFWLNIDPFDSKGQFCDKGTQYTSAIYYKNEAQKIMAEKTKEALKKKSKIKGDFLTEIISAKPFYSGEEYHQNYYIKNPVRYKYYRYSCGRDQRLKEIWGAN